MAVLKMTRTFASTNALVCVMNMKTAGLAMATKKEVDMYANGHLQNRGLLILLHHQRLVEHFKICRCSVK